MSKAQEAIARARRTANAAKADSTKMAAGAVTSYLIGSMEAAGTLSSIPQPFGLPRTVVLAVVGKAIAYNTSGQVSDALDGAASAAANIGIYQFASGRSVSGVGDDVGAGRAIRDRGRRLESAAQRAMQLAAPSEGGVDAELDALEGRGPKVVKKIHANA